MENGKRILIIGNGFDLAHGFPTKYGDFLNFSKKLIECQGFKDIELYLSTSKETEFNDLQKRLLAKWFESNSEEPVLFKSYISFIGNNIWYEYFIYQYKNHLLSGENWVDFEAEIKSVIQELEELLKQKQYSSFTEIKVALNGGRSTNSTNSQVRIKMSLYKKLRKFISAINENKIISIDDLRELMFDDLERIILAFELYLYFIFDSADINKKDIIMEINPDYILNFNYTNTFEYYFPNAKSCYIHGKCRNVKLENDLPNNMVLGIDEYLDDEIKDIDTYFSIFKKFIQRLRNKNDTKYAEWINTIENIYSTVSKERRDGLLNPISYSSGEELKGVTEVYVFGHSLNVTDKDILMKFLGSDATTVKIFAKDKSDEGRLISNLIRIIGEDCIIKKSTCYPVKLEFIRIAGKQELIK